jgi:hypothetical protein
MNIIRGNEADHKAFVKWAKKRNEKLLAFVVEPEEDLPKETTRDILELPDKIDVWLKYNCFLDFVKDHYCDLHGPDYWID